MAWVSSAMSKAEGPEQGDGFAHILLRLMERAPWPVAVVLIVLIAAIVALAVLMMVVVNGFMSGVTQGAVAIANAFAVVVPALLNGVLSALPYITVVMGIYFFRDHAARMWESSIKAFEGVWVPFLERLLESSVRVVEGVGVRLLERLLHEVCRLVPYIAMVVTAYFCVEPVTRMFVACTDMFPFAMDAVKRNPLICASVVIAVVVIVVAFIVWREEKKMEAYKIAQEAQARRDELEHRRRMREIQAREEEARTRRKALEAPEKEGGCAVQ